MKKSNEKWHFMIGRGMHPVIVMDLVYKGHTKFFGKVFNLPFNIYFMERYEGATYFLEREYQRVILYFSRKLKKKLSEFYKFPVFFEEKNSELTNFLGKIEIKKIKKFSNEKIKQILNKFFEDYAIIVLHFYLPFFVEDLLTNELKKIILPKLREIKKEDKLEEYIYCLTQDVRPSGANEEKIALLRIADYISKRKELINKEAFKHWKKYFGVYTYLFNVKEYTFNNVILNIKKYIKENPQKLLKEALDEQKKIKDTQNKILEEIKLSKKGLEILKLAQYYVYFRNVRVTQMGNFQCLIKHILEDWGRRRNLTYQEVINLTHNEILTGKFNKKELKKRLDGYVYLLENGSQHIITGKDKERFLKKEGMGIKEEKIEVIKGLTVFPGKVKGKVRKATPYTFDLLKKRDILVCSMTIVEATPYLSRCKAIITDEGGITCHAAIVSRELKIPCIVGTKIATKVLKDGDLVEVDAEKGIVRVLKRRT